MQKNRVSSHNVGQALFSFFLLSYRGHFNFNQPQLCFCASVVVFLKNLPLLFVFFVVYICTTYSALCEMFQTQSSTNIWTLFMCLSLNSEHVCMWCSRVGNYAGSVPTATKKLNMSRRTKHMSSKTALISKVSDFILLSWEMQEIHKVQSSSVHLITA